MINEANLLLNNEIIVKGISRFAGRRGTVTQVMADGGSLDVDLEGVGDVFLDVSLVEEVHDTQPAKVKQSLGPIANNLVKDTI